MTPERIRALRKRLGLTQVDLERLLGHGAKVVTRWEQDKVKPNPGTDMLLALLEKKPELLNDIREIRSKE